MHSNRLLCAALSLTLLAGSLLAASVPRKSPEFAISTVEGGQVLLSHHRGKVVALMFILTGCPHCQQTTQVLTKLQREYGPRGFQALASAIDEVPRLTVPDFQKRFQPAFPVGFSHRDSAADYLQHSTMFRMMMPQLVFVDRQGQIRAQYAGDDQFLGADSEKNLRGMIEKLLGEGASASRSPKKK